MLLGLLRELLGLLLELLGLLLELLGLLLEFPLEIVALGVLGEGRAFPGWEGLGCPVFSVEELGVRVGAAKQVGTLVRTLQVVWVLYGYVVFDFGADYVQELFTKSPLPGIRLKLHPRIVDSSQVLRHLVVSFAGLWQVYARPSSAVMGPVEVVQCEELLAEKLEVSLRLRRQSTLEVPGHFVQQGEKMGDPDGRFDVVLFCQVLECFQVEVHSFRIIEGGH